MIYFPFETNRKLMVLGVPILKHFRVSCFRKSEVTAEIFSVCNVTEKLMKYGIHCLPYSNTNDVINTLL